MIPKQRSCATERVSYTPHAHCVHTHCIQTHCVHGLHAHKRPLQHIQHSLHELQSLQINSSTLQPNMHISTWQQSPNRLSLLLRSLYTHLGRFRCSSRGLFRLVKDGTQVQLVARLSPAVSTCYAVPAFHTCARVGQACDTPGWN